MADEKDEKFNEKDREKQDEKAEEKAQEKTWEEKWQRDPLMVVVWGLIFIWAGLVFLASNLGLLDNLPITVKEIPGAGRFNDIVRAWPLVLLGAGVIVLFEILIRLVVPKYHKPIFGNLLLAIILIGLGLSNLINLGVVVAILIIVVGAYILFRGLRRKPE